MKVNLPVTGSERNYSAQVELISTTDTKGIVTFANKSFVDVCGFSEAELIGKNHNTVRHPDMPPEAFANLWDTLKQGGQWMGIVKNRCKNGDHYYVDAYVTPVYEGDQVVAYQSLRVKPEQLHVERAERLYKQLREKKKPRIKRFDFSLGTQMFIGFMLACMPALGLMMWVGKVSPVISLAALALAGSLGFVVTQLVMRPIRKAVKETRAILHNPLMQMIYFGANNEATHLQLVTRVLQARIRTVVGRISTAASQLSSVAGDVAVTMERTCKDIEQQQMETDQVATATNEMSATVQEVARNAEVAANATRQADHEASKGKSVVSETIGSIDMLATEVNEASQVIQKLDEDSTRITVVLDVIKGIAEQTNLLALNAAIEAARAGEQGRGFAVVADEVRTLAQRTQQSTQQIQQMIEQLQLGAKDAVKVMQRDCEQAHASVEQAAQAGTALESIAQKISTITDMNNLIASTAEEQSMVAEEISRNINKISHLAQDTTVGAHHTVSASRQMAELAAHMESMVRQFR